jgi:hypothetical protein
MYPYNFIHHYFNPDIVDTKPESVFARLEIDKRSGLKTGNIPHDVYSDIMGFEMDFSKTAAENTDLILSKTENFSGQDKSHSLGLFFEFIFKTGDYKFVIDSFHLLSDKLDSGDIQFDPRAYYYVASAMLAMDLFTGALKIADIAIKKVTDNKFLFSSLKGKILRAEGKPWLAADCFVEAIHINCKYPEPYWALYFLPNKLNQNKCRDIYNEIKKYADENPPVNFYMMLSELAHHAGYPVDANKLLRMQMRKKAEIKARQIGGRVMSAPINEPDFIIIGMPKCGTTSLHASLCARDDIIGATSKEIAFFNMRYERGIDWYRSAFPHVIGSNGVRLLTGEASPVYVYSESVLERISRDTQNTKLIVMVRDPVMRTISGYYHQKKMSGLNMPIKDFVSSQLAMGDKSDFLRRSIYLNYLKSWMDAFGESRVLLVDADSLFSGREELKKVVNFLSLRDSKASELPHANKGSYPLPEPSILQELSQFYQPYNEKFYSYAGRNFGWM